MDQVIIKRKALRAIGIAIFIFMLVGAAQASYIANSGTNVQPDKVLYSYDYNDSAKKGYMVGEADD